MKVIVTGGAGFIGSHTAQGFASRGADVIAIDNLSRSQLLGDAAPVLSKDHNWVRLEREPRIVKREGDVRRIEDLRPLVNDADVIIHAAAQVAVTSSISNPRADFEANALGTFNVLEAARLARSSPMVLYTSTNKVYAANVNRIPLREEGDRYSFADKKFTSGIPSSFSVDSDEHTPYGVSKLTADQYTRDYYSTYGLRTAVFRMSCIYGEHQSGSEDQGWVAHFLLSSLRGNTLTIYGDGKQVRDILHVDDLVNAFESIARTPSALTGRAYNIGGGSKNTISLLELLRWLQSRVPGVLNVEYKDWRPGDQRVYISDFSAATEAFGWQPRIGLENGLTRLLKWCNSLLGIGDSATLHRPL